MLIATAILEARSRAKRRVSSAVRAQRQNHRGERRRDRRRGYRACLMHRVALAAVGLGLVCHARCRSMPVYRTRRWTYDGWQPPVSGCCVSIIAVWLRWDRWRAWRGRSWPYWQDRPSGVRRRHFLRCDFVGTAQAVLLSTSSKPSVRSGVISTQDLKCGRHQRPIFSHWKSPTHLPNFGHSFIF